METDGYSDIAQASEQQSTEVSQIDQGIYQVSRVVESNAEIAQECAESSEELAKQADALQLEVFHFKHKE